MKLVKSFFINVISTAASCTEVHNCSQLSLCLGNLMSTKCQPINPAHSLVYLHIGWGWRTGSWGGRGGGVTTCGLLLQLDTAQYQSSCHTSMCTKMCTCAHGQKDDQSCISGAFSGRIQGNEEQKVLHKASIKLQPSTKSM